MQNNSLSRAELSCEGGEVLNVHYGDILVKYGEVLDVEKDELSYLLDSSLVSKYQASLLQNGDVIIADAAEDETVGKCSEIAGLTTEKVLSGLHTIPCRPKKKFAEGYLGYYMNSEAYHDQLLPLIQGTKISSISKSAIQDTAIIFPKLEEEQAQIGAYFRGVDKLITLHQRKIRYLQLTFNDVWEQRKFGELVEKYEDPVETPTNGYMRLGIRSHAKGTFHSYVEEGKELETAKMFRVAANNFIVNITFGWEHAVAITDENDAGKLVSHRFPQYQFHNGMVPKFFRYLILDECFKHHLELSSPGGAGRNRVLKLDDMLDYKMRFPSKWEQEKIASYFDNLDSLITLHQCKCRICRYFEKNDWEQRKLGEIAEKVTEKNRDNLYDEPFTNSAEQGIISQKDYFDREVVNEENLDGYYVVRDDDFVYNPRVSVSAPVGPINRNKLGKNGVMSPLYTVFRTHDINTTYLEHYFKTKCWHLFMKMNGDSGARFDRFSIATALFMEMPIPYPDLKEQAKIGGYFERLDHLITLHQCKCCIRVSKGFFDWEQRKLEDVVKVCSGRDYKHLEEGDIPVYGTGGYMLSVSESLSEKEDAIGIGRKGTIDSPYILRAPFWTVDTLFYCIPKGNYVLDFVFSIYQNINWKSMDESTGVPSLSKALINNVDVMVPIKEEQEKLGNYFAKIDHLITLHQRMQKASKKLCNI